MSKVEFTYQAVFLLGKDKTEYYLLTSEHIGVGELEGETVLKVAPEAFTLLAQQVFHGVSFVLRPEHQQQVASVLHDPEASENDKYVALQFLRNPEIAAKGVLPVCQDTGTVTITGKKGQYVQTGGGDEAALSKGIFNIYIEDNLRYSQNAALDMYKEANTGTSLPAQIGLHSADGDEYKFLRVAKGGGSANKTYLYQETKALLTLGKLKSLLVEKMCTSGTAAHPPYYIVLVIGDISAESTLKMVKLVSTHYCDALPTESNAHGQAFRGPQPEQGLLEEAQKLGLDAQLGGKYFAYDIRVIHLSRHGASCLVGMGVSCSADRSTKAKVNHGGIWIGRLEHSPDQYIPKFLRQTGEGEVVEADLDHPMKEILVQLSQYLVPTCLSLSGTVIIGRDIVHARLKERIDSGGGLSQYVKDYLICYASPTKTPTGYPSGSLGPTTAGRMGSYVDLLQPHGNSMIILTRGDRSQQVTDAYHKHGGFYLGSTDGPAAIPVQQSIKHLEYVGYPELGAEAIWKIEAEGLPALILVNDKGNDFFQQIVSKQCANCAKWPIRPSTGLTLNFWRQSSNPPGPTLSPRLLVLGFCRSQGVVTFSITCEFVMLHVLDPTTLRTGTLILVLILTYTSISASEKITWLMEIVPVITTIPLLLATMKQYPLALLLYMLIFSHAIILIVGGMYTYTEVPIGLRVQEWLDLGRNPYDKLGHFFQRLIPAPTVREVLVCDNIVRGRKMLSLLVYRAALATNAMCELTEWQAALAIGQGTDDFLDTQGDLWDTQSDMFCALLGALAMVLALAG